TSTLTSGLSLGRILRFWLDHGNDVGIKSLLEVTAVKVRVITAKQNLVLFSNLNEKYAK
ncbi:hypothetical protein Tco_0547238, partial [Tanacetum coccineum]